MVSDTPGGAAAAVASTQNPDLDSRLLYQVAERWAPVQYQDVDRTGNAALHGRADFITSIHFDSTIIVNDWDTSNNVANLAAGRGDGTQRRYT